jgi:dTDP-4-dehydrorhamnose 3,5-epimerase
MIFNETRVRGAYTMDLELHTDHRGFFARAWCQKEVEARGLTPKVVQVNVSFSARKGTLRGMHYQCTPCQEAKVVSCTRGAIYDVVLDLRRDSPTYLLWDAVELTPDNHRMLYIPEGCAHGCQTLADETELLYLMSEFYSPEHTRGVRYNDSAFRIRWPLVVRTISDADRAWPDYEPDYEHGVREGLASAKALLKR